MSSKKIEIDESYNTINSTQFVRKNFENVEVLNSIDRLGVIVKKSFGRMDTVFDKIKDSNSYYYYILNKLFIKEAGIIQQSLNDCLLGCKTKVGISSLNSCYIDCIDDTNLNIVNLEYKFTMYVEDNQYHVTKHVSDNDSRLNDAYEFKQRNLDLEVFKKFI